MPATSPADILRLAGIAAEVTDEALGIVARLDAAHIGEALAALQTVGYDFLVDLFGTDRDEHIELTYHVRAMATLEDLYLKVAVPYDGEAPSVWRVYPAALYPEREAAELLGMSFPGHANPKRLLTTDAVGPLLRRSVLGRGAEAGKLP